MRSKTVSSCLQARRETYTALPLATPKVAGADSLAAAFSAIEADPFGFYANVSCACLLAEDVAGGNNRCRSTKSDAC